jgi:hypothetical protein
MEKAVQTIAAGARKTTIAVDQGSLSRVSTVVASPTAITEPPVTAIYSRAESLSPNAGGE